jgi:hypothetical protein
LQPWLWTSALVWIMTVITTPPIVNHVPAPTSAYGVAALWYQITAFVGTLIVAVQRVWGDPHVVQEVLDRLRDN